MTNNHQFERSDRMKRLYFIGGTMGVGKTSVCQELKNKLPSSVFLDGDWCWDTNPSKITEETKKMVIDNISYLINNYLLCSEYDNVIFCWVMHEQSIIDSLTDRIKTRNYKLINISLIGDETTIKKRLLKDVNNGIRTIDVIERSIERLHLYNSLNTIKFDTSNKTINEIANEIIDMKL